MTTKPVTIERTAVMGKQGVEGIFTAADACQAFAPILRRAVA